MSTFTVILGAGESGTGAAILAKKMGHRVWLSDKGMIKDQYLSELNQYEIPFEAGHHDESLILIADQIIKSPGIPDTAPLVLKAKQKGIPVISEIEFAALQTDAKLIGITGTNGKTTTTMLTHHILSKAGLKVGLGGNVGKSFARQVAEEDHDYYVLELSSFQLDGMFKTRIHMAVLLNITPDHLDRYPDMDAYIASKFRITQNQTEEDLFIYCQDDPIVAQYIQNHSFKSQMLPFSIEKEISHGAWSDLTKMFITLNPNNNQFIMELNQLTISGKHNTYNSMAAAIIANALLIRKELIRESLSDFRNVEHRLEPVARIKGVDFINDSKATNVNSAWYALESMEPGVIWIAGGVDKGNDYSQLQELVKEKVRLIICLGTDNRRIHDAFSKDVEMIVNTQSASEAVNIAYNLARKGETVLLSPACASFDLFENYEDRGRQFKDAVRSL
jgi:UDP-N-acetylmuramoylalanine--D-glutamate ligase